MADILVSSLLPWRSALRNLALQNIRFSSPAPEACGSLSWLSEFLDLQSLELHNVSPTLISSMDLKSCTALQKLDISKASYDNPVRIKLHLSFFPSLRELRCASCRLCRLDVTPCPNLEVLEVSGNSLKTLDLSKNPSLSRLSCTGSELKHLDLTVCPLLEVVRLSHNPLTTGGLRVAGCSSLKVLGVEYCKMDQLDLSGCASLTSLFSHCSSLAEVNLSGCTLLQELDLYFSPTRSLNVTGCVNLLQLICTSEYLTTITLAGCTALQSLDLHRTLALRCLDLSGCKASLQTLLVERSGLAALDLGATEAGLQELSCWITGYVSVCEPARAAVQWEQADTAGRLFVPPLVQA